MFSKLTRVGDTTIHYTSVERCANSTDSCEKYYTRFAYHKYKNIALCILKYFAVTILSLLRLAIAWLTKDVN